MLSCYYVLVKITALSCRMEGGYFNMYNITSNAKIFWTNIKNNIILKYSFIHIIPPFLYSEMLLHYFISNNTFSYTKSRTTTRLFPSCLPIFILYFLFFYNIIYKYFLQLKRTYTIFTMYRFFFHWHFFIMVLI